MHGHVTLRGVRLEFMFQKEIPLSAPSRSTIQDVVNRQKETRRQPGNLECVSDTLLPAYNRQSQFSSVEIDRKFGSRIWSKREISIA